MKRMHPRSRLLVSLALAVSVLGLTTCTTDRGTPAVAEGGTAASVNRSHGSTPASATAGASATLPAATAASPSNGGAALPGAGPSGYIQPSRTAPERGLRGRLLPRDAVPARLVPAAASLLPNEEAARYFPDPAAALRAMEAAERVGGALADYRLPFAPDAADQAVAVISSVALYRTAAAAQNVVADPTLALVVESLGLHVTEIATEQVGDASHTFRGSRAGDGPDRITYVVVFQHGEAVGTVIVAVPTGADDGGRLALELAQRQAAT